MSKPPGEPQEEAIKIPDVLPVLPLKDTVVFPYIILPLSVGRDKSVLAVDRALSESRVIMLVAQRDAANDNPGEADLFEVGTAAVIMRMLKLPDGRIRILVQGLSRARINHISQIEPYLQAKIERIEEPPAGKSVLEVEALVRSVKESLDRAVTLGKGISAEVMVIAANLEDPGRLADLAASNLELKLSEAQAVLETIDPIERLRRVSELLAREIQVLTMQQEISSQARGEIDRSQREYFLRQQLKAIQQELGEGEELSEEIANYRRLAEEKKLSEEAREELERQIRRLERSHPESAETQIIRTYLDWVTSLPWETTSEDNLDLEHAQNVLDEDHYDLEKIKERILEYLAVRKLKSGHPRPDPLLRRSARRGQDLARPLDRPLAGPQVRPHLARRRARRGRDPRPPPHLRRRAARPHRPGHPAGRHEQPRVRARRDRQDRRRLPRRPVVGPARGARSGAELQLRRSLPRRALRPLQGDVHRHGEHAGADPAGLPRPHGGDPPDRLHARREAPHRPAPPDPQADEGARADRGTGHVHRRRPSPRSSPATPRKRACGTWSARSPPSAARWR